MVSKGDFASVMDYKILEESINKFHQSNILGVGGFGCVYKAQIVDGSYAAVTKLDFQAMMQKKNFRMR
ncbi:hypothetical protein V6N13_149188 [Hibiscus sabdariffa]